MPQRLASSAMIVMMAFVLVAVTAILIAVKPAQSAERRESQVTQDYIPAADEPPVIDARIEDQRTA